MKVDILICGIHAVYIYIYINHIILTYYEIEMVKVFLEGIMSCGTCVIMGFILHYAMY